MKVRGGELRYPRPDNWVVVPKQKYAAGDLIGTAYHTTSPVLIKCGLIKLEELPEWKLSLSAGKIKPSTTM